MIKRAMRWKCGCAYDGKAYAGWQSQNEEASVQGVLQDALGSIFKQPVAITGSGRTDAGVHALEQVFHFDADWAHGGERLQKALYSKTPRDMQILYAHEVDDSFHARFSATSKRYHYRLHIGECDPFRWPYCWAVSNSLDLNPMREAMGMLVGKHDFKAFAANRGIEYESTVRNMMATEMYQDRDYIYLSFEAEGFMYKMVRSLAGALVNVGMRRLELSALRDLLEGRDRIPMVQVAPARGLFLERVFYG